MVTSQYEWKLLKWDDKPRTNKRIKRVAHSFKVYLHSYLIKKEIRNAYLLSYKHSCRLLCFFKGITYSRNTKLLKTLNISIENLFWYWILYHFSIVVNFKNRMFSHFKNAPTKIRLTIYISLLVSTTVLLNKAPKPLYFPIFSRIFNEKKSANRLTLVDMPGGRAVHSTIKATFESQRA